MANEIAQVVDVQIVTESNPLTVRSFGTPLILSNKQWTGTDLVRTYNLSSDMLTDGFQVTDPEYKMAALLQSQAQRLPAFMVGRRSHQAVQRFAITPPGSLVAGATYSVLVNGSPVSVTVDGTPTAAEFTAALTTAITALSLSGVTATDGSTLVHVAVAPGSPALSLALPEGSTLAIAEDDTDPGITADLSAIQAENDSWYTLLSPYPGSASIQSIAAWTEAAGKLYVQEVQDSAVANTAPSGASDIAATLKAANYRRTATIFHPNDDAFADAAWAGQTLPFAAGSETWALQQLSGVAAVPLTATQRANIEGKNSNHFTNVGGANITRPGKVASGEWIDVVRGQDWTTANIQARVFLAKLRRTQTQGKVPYDDKGVAVLENEVRAGLGEAQARGFIEPGWTVSATKTADASPTDRANRVFNSITFEAFLTGAIHTTKVRGTISV